MITATRLNRGLSASIAIGYIVIASMGEDAAGQVARVVAGLIFPMAAIWFGDFLGSLTGWVQGRYIDQTTPGGFVCFGGWLLLVGVPLVLLLAQLANG